MQATTSVKRDYDGKATRQVTALVSGCRAVATEGTLATIQNIKSDLFCVFNKSGCKG